MEDKIKKPHFKDREYLIGQKIGKLTIIEVGIPLMTPRGTRIQGARCVCDCGKEVIKRIDYLLTSKDLMCSCGCWVKEKIRLQGLANSKHNEYDLTGEYGIGYCSNTGREFYFDLEDYDLIKDYCISEHRPTKQEYERPIYSTRVGPNGEPAKSHPLWYLLGLKGYDHINNNTFDNRRCNLRPCTQQQNVFNSKLARNNRTGITGVCSHGSTGKWRARLMLNYEEINLGYYENFDDAVRARLLGEKKYFGEFAPQRRLFSIYGVTED